MTDKYPQEGVSEGYRLANPDYEAFRAELVAADRVCYTPSQRDTLPEFYIVKAKCSTHVKKFLEKFPELTHQRGWVNSQERQASGARGGEHWWCVAPDGSIVDPTLNQFYFWREPEKLVYRIFDPEKDVIPIGKCMNCGMEVWGLEKDGPASICSPEEDEEESECAKSYSHYLCS